MPHAKIAVKQATHTLEQLHAELAGKILDNKREAKRLAESMVHVEAVLKLLVPGYDVRPIAIRRRKTNPWFKRGTVLRHALGVLRTAKGPLTAREITVAMLAARGVTDPPRKELRGLITSVQSCLHNYKGDILRPVGQGMPGRWALVGGFKKD
jgi:hypothetical protein